ncbi:TPA: relaxase/mobilization nuclease domain-containing protein [Pseudomonas aeruginosa]|nr:relaxase/mobilization nuclease domain-containing protein [Pseudomonas aeruginosa]
MAMHGFSGHSGSGGGGGSGPVNYLMDDHYYDKEADIWLPREPLPEVIEGNPALMVQLIDALDHKHKYTSGVLSFSHDDTNKLKASGLGAAITDITGRLKEMLFAGIAPEHQHILIVAHMHLDRLELHYVTPRHNYEVDRAWNPAPPGKGKFRQMDALTDFINVKYGLDDPRDPLRARSTKDIQWEPVDRKSTRETLNAFFKEAVIEGVIDNRQELIELAKKAGFEITRTGKDYVSMKAPGAEKAIRLKGEIYNEQFTSRAELANTKTKSAERAAYLSKPAVAQRYKQAIRERKCFIEERFKKALGIARTGKDYSETQRFHGAKRGTLVDTSKGRASDFGYKHPDSHNINNRIKINDSTRRAANEVIERSERLSHEAEQIFSRASRVIKAGVTVAKSAIERIREPVATPPYGVPPIAPSAMASAGASEVSGGFSPADTGDPESDRIINSKRSESIAAAQQEAVRNKQAAFRIQESLKIVTSLIP